MQLLITIKLHVLASILAKSVANNSNGIFLMSKTSSIDYCLLDPMAAQTITCPDTEEKSNNKSNNILPF